MSIRSRHRLLHDLIIAGAVMSMMLGVWAYYEYYWPRHDHVEDAIFDNDFDDVARYLRRHPSSVRNPDQEENPLALAINAYHHRMARFILERRGGANSRGFFYHDQIFSEDEYTLHLIHVAANGENPGMFHLLVEYGADWNVTDELGLSPLHYAVATGSSDIVRRLISFGADVDAVVTLENYFLSGGSNHVTPLGLAMQNNDTEIIRLLRDAGANAEQQVFVEEIKWKLLLYTPSDTAAAMVEVLIQSGASVDDTPGGAMAFIYSAAARPETLQMLIDRGVSISARDEYGNTAAHAAAVHAELESLRLLVQHGINVNLRNNDGHNAMDTILRARDRKLNKIQDVYARIKEIMNSNPHFRPRARQDVVEELHERYDPAIGFLRKLGVKTAPSISDSK